MDKPFQVKFKFRELLEQERIKVSQLVDPLEGKISKVTLYRWNSNSYENVNTDSIGWVIYTLKQLTGKSYKVSDLLEYSE